MKHTLFYLIIALFSSWLIGCTPPDTESESDIPETASVDTLKTRALRQLRLSAKDAFLKLSDAELLLEGMQKLSKQERKELLKTHETAYYSLQWVGNYLQVTEKITNPDAFDETLEQLRLAAFNSMKHQNILFLSQERVDPQRDKVEIVQQTFLKQKQHVWEDITHKIPEITTQTFLEDSAKLNISNHHIYFELLPEDINYLQALLKHEAYPNKDEIAEKETYKVALVWTGNEFRLDRRAMVQYDISEHHSK